MKSMTYGTMPHYDEYQQAFERECVTGTYGIRNCKELETLYIGGNLDLDIDELWCFLESCCDGWQDNHEMGDVASGILSTLGFEWI
jgi:hypothetical protein